ncbi:uncharacterized protein LOC132235896 [Myotis daubentonii]|uniref:uncharacterized protein LOC132235896 n=1 Tax=Myotis daubentonii TaxID=98922 RepID=UPI00287305CC|nr:uncharacterized protein LOC132235896 [Myotis daubentonii]
MDQRRWPTRPHPKLQRLLLPSLKDLHIFGSTLRSPFGQTVIRGGAAPPNRAWATSAEARLPPSLWEPGEQRYHSNGPARTYSSYKEHADSPGGSRGGPGVASEREVDPAGFHGESEGPRPGLGGPRIPNKSRWERLFANARPRERLAGPGCLAAGGLQRGQDDQALTSRPRPPFPVPERRRGRQSPVPVLEAFTPTEPPGLPTCTHFPPRDVSEPSVHFRGRAQSGPSAAVSSWVSPLCSGVSPRPPQPPG